MELPSLDPHDGNARGNSRKSDSFLRLSEADANVPAVGPKTPEWRPGLGPGIQALRRRCLGFEP
jgi:hypothetical protein